MSDMKAFKGFTSMNYANQGKAFLNAYWGDCQDKAEKVWEIVNKFKELDLDKAENGCDLDEFNAHRVLEFFGETKTVKEMREELLKADLDFNKRLAVIEYCLWSNGKTVSEFVKRPQGESDAIKKAQEMLNQVLAALADSQEKAKIAKTKLAEAIASEKSAAEFAAQAKIDLEEQKAALAEVQKLEDAYNQKTESLKAKTESGGVVSRNRAKNELAQHLEEDPLPLRTAKISNEAATRKAEKSRVAAEESHAAAVQARKDAEEAKASADEAVQVMEQKMVEAQEALEDAKKTGSGQGNVWWIERQLTEAKKYMPMSKGGIRK